MERNLDKRDPFLDFASNSSGILPEKLFPFKYLSQREPNYYVCLCSNSSGTTEILKFKLLNAIGKGTEAVIEKEEVKCKLQLCQQGQLRENDRHHSGQFIVRQVPSRRTQKCHKNTNMTKKFTLCLEISFCFTNWWIQKFVRPINVYILTEFQDL